MTTSHLAGVNAVPVPIVRGGAVHPLGALVFVLALAGLPAAPASAHAGAGLNHPIFEQMLPTVPGLDVAVVYSVN